MTVFFYLGLVLIPWGVKCCLSKNQSLVQHPGCWAGGRGDYQKPRGLIDRSDSRAEAREY
jgi:hypothetical protein